eukprot:COSAG02_NODE_1122_length_14450_cov_4.124173_16_plen_118_part_00
MPAAVLQQFGCGESPPKHVRQSGLQQQQERDLLQPASPAAGAHAAGDCLAHQARVGKPLASQADSGRSGARPVVLCGHAHGGASEHAPCARGPLLPCMFTTRIEGLLDLCTPSTIHR